MVTELIKPFKPSAPVHFENQPELFPGKRRRTEGPCVYDVADLNKLKSFCSHDVLQQTPEVLDVPVDQQHVVNEWRPTASNVMPDARWSTVIPEEVIAARPDVLYQRLHGVSQVYKFKECDVNMTLKPVDTVDMDAEGCVVGINGVCGRLAVAEAKSKARKFRRIGTFDQKVKPTHKDYLTPKVYGEPIFMKCVGGQGFGVCRLGNTWEFKCDDDIRILIECFPGIRNPERVFLLNAWRWNTVNNVGVLYGKEIGRAHV